MPNPKKLRQNCRTCGGEPARPAYKYCSNVCQQEYQYRVYIEKWKAGDINGLSVLGLVSPYIKKYLRRKYQNKCHLCGWSEINQSIGYSPLVADHVDGNWRNNVESNLRLLCPNCDALSPTYAGLNKGKGRKNRARSKRAQEGRLLKIKPL